MLQITPLLRQIGLVGLVVTIALRLTAAEPAWQMLEAPTFTVFSQLTEKKTREWSEEFNEFIEELRHMFTIKDAELPPLTVVIFARDRDFMPYKGLRPDGKAPRDIAGFFSRRESWSVVGLAGGYATEDIRHLIFHEGVHWYMSAIPRKFPVWFEEGVAEVFATFKREKGKVHWGVAIPRHVQLLHQENLMPLERMLFIDRQDPLFNEGTRTSIFYAQSWLFVHYLMFAKREGARSAMDDYLGALQVGSATADDAFRSAFGGDYRKIEDDLRRNLRSGRFFIPTRPQSAASLANTSVVPAPPHLVETARARLAAASRRYDVATAHVARAIELAPANPAGHEARALLAYDRRDFDEARAAAATAERLGSSDANTLFLLAYLSAREEAARGGLWGKPAREIANLYHRVVALCPSFDQAYINLSALVASLDPINEEDVATLKKGLARNPRSGEIVLGIVQILWKHGDRDQALELLRATRARGLAGDFGRMAADLEEHWNIEIQRPRIEEMVRNNDLAGAIALYDELLPRVKNVQSRGNLIRGRRGLVIRLKIEEANTAVLDGQFDRARTLYDEILGSAELPVPLRRSIQDRIASLPAVPEPVVAP